LGDLDGAMELYIDKERIYREIGLKDELSCSLLIQGCIVAQKGEFDRARVMLDEAHQIAVQDGYVALARQIEEILEQLNQ